MVRPTGQPLNGKIGAWAVAEQAHAIEHWRRQFRGDARVQNDNEVTDSDIASIASVKLYWVNPHANPTHQVIPFDPSAPPDPSAACPVTAVLRPLLQGGHQHGSGQACGETPSELHPPLLREAPGLKHESGR